MKLSKEDMFCEGMVCTAAAKASTNVLDFHKHGDDVLGKLFFSVHVDAVDSANAGASAVDKDLLVEWETSDAEDFGTTKTLWSKSVAKAGILKGAYIVKDEPLPRGLKRYNRLKFTEASGTKFPDVTAFVHDGRDAGTPYKG